MKGFVSHHDLEALRDLGGGMTRRVLAHSGELMAVEVGFEAGGFEFAHPLFASRCLSGEGWETGS